MNSLSGNLAVKERRGSRLTLKEKIGSEKVHYEDKRKTSTFIGREERASRSRSLGCKHLVS